MQTFLVDNDLEFVTTMRCLDNKRLGKQRVEALQILNALQGRSRGWVSHPAVVMWRGYEEYLSYYHDRCIEEWKLRGFKNTMPYKTLGQLESYVAIPHWWDDQRTFASHRSNLLRKDYTHYSQFNWKESDDLPYHWPT